MPSVCFIQFCFILLLQVSHTLLSMIDSETGQPFLSTQKRLNVFTKMLRSGIPQSFNWMSQIQPPLVSQHSFVEDAKSIVGTLYILHNWFLVSAFVRISLTWSLGTSMVHNCISFATFSWWSANRPTYA